MRHMAPIFDFPDCMRRQVRFLLTDTTQLLTQTKIPHGRARCSHAKAKRWNQEAMQCPKLDRCKTPSKARICGTRGNVKRRKGVNPYAFAEMLTLRTCWYSWTVLLSGSIECRVPISVFDISILPSTCTRLDPAIYIRTRGSTGWSGLNSPA